MRRGRRQEEPAAGLLYPSSLSKMVGGKGGTSQRRNRLLQLQRQAWWTNRISFVWKHSGLSAPGFWTWTYIMRPHLAGSEVASVELY